MDYNERALTSKEKKDNEIAIRNTLKSGESQRSKSKMVACVDAFDNIV